MKVLGITERPVNRQSKLGFPFTEEGDRRMQSAIAGSIEFMANYGKGREPIMVDISYYENHNPEEECQQEENTDTE